MPRTRANLLIMNFSSSAVVSAGLEARAEREQCTFLIVDDSPVIRGRLASMLSEIDGVRLIGEADNAIDGANMIRELRPDAVILDIRMPDRSGIGLLESIKECEDLPVVIVLTNYPYAAYRKRCFGLGASHFFDKSTEFDALEEVVRDMARVGS